MPHSSLPAVTGFQEAFESWLAAMQHGHQLDSSASENAYRALWQPFARWCLAQSPSLTLETIDAPALMRYVKSRDGRSAGRTLSDRHVWRVLQLIDRVMLNHAQRLPVRRNTCAAELLQSIPEWRHANAAHRNPLPACLTATEAARLVAYLARTPDTAGTDPLASKKDWQMLRNRATVALHLGAGLTPQETRALTLDSPVAAGGRTGDRPWKITVAATDGKPARQAPLAAWAGRLLAAWIRQRRLLNLPGPWLFPSTLSGKPWRKVAHYNAISRLLEEAGLQDKAAPTGGAYQLRHTYALRQLKRGHSELQVSRWMGVEVEEMARYRHVVHDTALDIA